MTFNIFFQDTEPNTGCFSVSTAGWNCPNGLEIDGLYSLTEDVNGKSAWKNSNGMYLRWASMWDQWIFDDDEQDITTVARKPADVTSDSPVAGTFTEFRYGTTCGNNGVSVQTLVISETDCNEGNAFYTFVIRDNRYFIFSNIM